MPLVAHHVEINLFDLIVIEPETMPEHAVLAAVSAVLIALVCYGARAVIRDVRAWLERRRDTAAA
jgi:membrane protein required for beta-lactamase induction